MVQRTHCKKTCVPQKYFTNVQCKIQAKRVLQIINDSVLGATGLQQRVGKGLTFDPVMTWNTTVRARY